MVSCECPGIFLISSKICDLLVYTSLYYLLGIIFVSLMVVVMCSYLLLLM